MIGISSYALKGIFQHLLTPAMERLIEWRVTPNWITLFSCTLCVLYAVVMATTDMQRTLLILMPPFLLLRMALNALDGMVAEASGQKTSWGSVLNEVCDVVSDIALLVAFIVVLPEYRVLLIVLLLLSLLIEFVSLALYQAIRIRPFSGPFSKSDRAIFMAILALVVWIVPDGGLWLGSLISAGLVLALVTLWNRCSVLNTEGSQ